MFLGDIWSCIIIYTKIQVGKNIEDEELKAIAEQTLRDADLDDDGRLDLEEFKKVVALDENAEFMTIQF